MVDRAVQAGSLKKDVRLEGAAKWGQVAGGVDAMPLPRLVALGSYCKGRTL